MNYSQWATMPIGGSWREGSSDRYSDNRNPYTGEVLVSHKLANLEDVNEAYETALRVQKEWASLTPEHHSRILETAAALLADRIEETIALLQDETGSTKVKATMEVNAAIALIKEAAAYPYKMNEQVMPSTIPGKENQIYREPVGVVNVITSWNFPLSLSMRSIAPALAAGNGVVIKPASNTPISGGSFIAKLFEDAGVPKGLICVIIGSGSEVGDAVVKHPIPRVISFTGSTEVGRRIGALAGQYLKEVSLELGGNNAFIVLDDADIEQAVKAATFGKFLHQGQICMAINRMIVSRSIYPTFIEQLKKQVSTLKVGDPRQDDTIIGPLIDEKQRDQVLSLIEKGKQSGANVFLEGDVHGNVISPFILTDVDNRMSIAQEEIFGPIALVIPVDSEEEAVRIANDTRYGLTASVFTAFQERAIRVAKQLHTGMVHINDQTVNSDPAMPFGGEKDSGIGRFGGQWIFEKFTTVKWVSVQHEKRHYPIFN
ncbi:aldehyde dehydrogenase family protein [Bacillus sp. Marseille-P3661]|uniref:aldehyde dehydrogenase family protein n=1 Tax=Bacillus sp. Marseille-P3661 TaxID=1936234 RepID=UPI000C829F8D|nr:aldehyde dehydrogenase family protein [Bacillus sp. Marseille-P3661]